MGWAVLCCLRNYYFIENISLKKKQIKSIEARVVKSLVPIFCYGKSMSYMLDSAEGVSHLDSFSLVKIKARCYEVIRWYHRLELILNFLLHKPLPKKEKEVMLLLCSSLAQIMRCKKDAHAVVNNAVIAARELNKKWACSLVNACLRKFLREYDSIIVSIGDSDIFKFSHPSWMLSKIKQSWKDNWQEILLANNKPAPMTIRVNRQLFSLDDYQRQLHLSGIESSKLYGCDMGLQLSNPVAVNKLPGFYEGSCSVQDIAGQRLVEILNLLYKQGDIDLLPKARYLDVCAAPGSKACHILESFAGLEEVVLLDKDPIRLQKVRDNINRLNLQPKKCNLIAADAMDASSWGLKEDVCFDLIICDVPCSGSGVIRRHPDIKLLRRPDDIKSLAGQQYKILQSSWELLGEGGVLVYSTCSIFPEENEHIISVFCAANKNAHILDPNILWGHKSKCGVYMLPGEDRSDGFFYSCLKKSN